MNAEMGNEKRLLLGSDAVISVSGGDSYILLILVIFYGS